MTSGLPCQDAFAYARLEPDLAVIAVADGAGSARFADRAASLSVDRAITYFKNVADLLDADLFLWSAAVRAAFDAARNAVFEASRAARVEPRHFATTLQVVLLGRDAYCYGRIGDGCGVGRCGEALIPLAPAPDNAFANETTFLTSAGAEPAVYLGDSPLSDCAVFTDGLQHLAMQLAQWRPHDPFFGPLFEYVRTTPDAAHAEADLDAYLRTDVFDQRTDDDRTLVISVWTADGAEAR